MYTLLRQLTICLAVCWLPRIAAGPAIRASVQASWSEAPLLVQILESFHLEAPANFFDLLTFISESDAAAGHDSQSTPQQVYTSTLALIKASKYLSGLGELDSLELSVSLREASAKIEAFHQHYASIRKPEQSQANQGCESWILTQANTSVCTLSDLEALKIDASTSTPALLLPFDHIYPQDHTPVDPSKPTYVLYANPNSKEFFNLHSYLSKKAIAGLINYVLRWKPAVKASGKKQSLSGYGVGLDIKKADYLAIDDRNLDASEAKVDDQGAATGLDDLKPLTRRELQNIGTKAVQHIMHSAEDPLDRLIALAQDFPMHAHSLATQWQPTINQSIHEELDMNRQTKLDGGKNAVWLNGQILPEKDLEPLSLLRILRQERHFIKSITDLGLTSSQAISLATHPAIWQKESTPSRGVLINVESLYPIFDASDRIEDGQVIFWWNDVEKDQRYASWSSDLQVLLRPAYPGQLAQLRRNLFNIIFVLDLSQTSSHMLITEYIMAFVQRSMPLRMGLVPLLSSDEDTDTNRMARLFMYVFAQFGKTDAMSFCLELSELPTLQIDMRSAKEAYSRLVAARSRPLVGGAEALSFEEAINQGDEAALTATKRYLRRLDLQKDGPTQQFGNCFINGKSAPVDEGFRKFLQQSLQQQQQYAQQQIYYREIDTLQDVSSLFYDLPGAYSKRNKKIFVDDSNPLDIIPVDGLIQVCKDRWTSENQWANLSLVVITADASASEALKAQMLENPTGRDMTRLCFIAVDELPAHDLRRLSVPESGEMVLLVNGRLLGPMSQDAFNADDYELLLQYELKERVGTVLKAVEAASIDASLVTSDLVSSLCATLNAATTIDKSASIFSKPSARRSQDYKRIDGKYSSFRIGTGVDAWASWAVALDPLSETAQKVAPLLRILASQPNTTLLVFLNPPEEIKELPLKRFYRHNFESKINFDQLGQQHSDAISFEGMLSKTLMTLALEAHQSWLAFPKQSVHDLDNIRLSDMSSTGGDVTVVYELDNIVIEGHCRDMPGSAPPRGLQLELISKSDASKVDSLVMANLGYIQLKANPGLYDLAVRAGRSSEVFHLESVGATGLKSANVSVTGSQVALTTMEGLTIYPRFARNPGMEEILDLLDEALPGKAAAAPSFVDQMKSKLGTLFGKGPDANTAALTTTENRGAEINVFTVASGLLYERMAFIMIVSVMRHTQSSVKFWFISNFLSPAFKSFIPHMAAEYGFDYELVTYKWPHWLRAQKEKQRTIWGYKILFLDVLFPLELSRVLFIDSDQIVRTDLKQLVDLDLQGTPYAYAPMGDDRTEMEGFRFWKTGYWREHLAGRPYHISALYVIDLEKFRQIAAGDRLRGQYQGLSSDPNSLANLDQDLPNNMQHQIPIYTLDRSWLWCETWCSDESLAEAKTIDLCNNPQTHEPKLARAKRLIPEWTVYDTAIATLAKRVAANQQSEESAVFQQEAGRLGQAKLQEAEFVEEGTGTVEIVEEKRKKDEL